MQTKKDLDSFCFSHLEDEFHSDFANSRANNEFSVYVEDATTIQLQAYAEQDTQPNATCILPLVVAGEKGVGKSTVIVNWALKRNEASSNSTLGIGYEECVFFHAIGCSRLSTQVSHLLRRLVSTLTKHFDLKDTIDLEDDKLPWILPRILERSSKKGRVTIVIDGGLQHICSQDGDYGLKWLPSKLPPNGECRSFTFLAIASYTVQYSHSFTTAVRMIVAVTQPSKNPQQKSDHATKLQSKIQGVWDEVQRRKWTMVRMNNMSNERVVSLIEKFRLIPSSNDDVSLEEKRQLLSVISKHPSASNPFFLTCLLRGLRHAVSCLGYNKYDSLRCLELWTSPIVKTAMDMMEQMISVFESGLSKKESDLHPVPRLTLDPTASRLETLLGHSLSLLFVAKHGLHETELFDLLGRVRQQLRWKSQTKDTLIPVKLRILRLLMQKKNRLIDIFRSLDEDGNGTLR